VASVTVTLVNTLMGVVKLILFDITQLYIVLISCRGVTMCEK